MITLDELKAAHPEWCFNCGSSVWQDGHGAAEGHICGVTTGFATALIAKAREDEARIEEDQLRIEDLGAQLLYERNKPCPGCGQ